MLHTSPYFSIKEIPVLVFSKKVFILSFTLIAGIAGLAAFFIFPHHYKAEIVFVLKNPLFADRGNIYSEPRSMNYFANEDDITRFISMANLDSLKKTVIKKFNLIEAYKLDSAKEKDQQKAAEIFSKSLTLYRAESNDIVLLYVDKNPRRAADIANFYVPLMEQSFRGLYNEMRGSVCNSIRIKIKEQDSSIQALTDTLVRLREQYKIYDIINPSRHNLMSGSMNAQGRPDYAAGIELIQNIESLKDELVSDRSYKMTLLNQYTTGNAIAGNSLIKIIQEARIPIKREGVGLKGIIFICVFFGFFVSLFYVIARHRLEKH